MVKRLLVDVGLGLLLFILVMILEFVVTLPSAPAGPDLPAPSRADLNREFLLTAAPALVTSAVVAMGSHTRSPRQGLRRGITWVVVLVAFYLAIGLGNGTTAMFATPGMWLTLAAVLLGAVGGGRLSERRALHSPGGKDSAPLRTRLT